MGTTILYLYPRTTKQRLFDTDKSSQAVEGRSSNLSSTFVNDLASRLDLKFVPDGRGDLQQNFGPEDIFNYMYAIFHSPAYRERYAEFLKIDFPRLPLTSSVNLFCELCKLGDRLVDLHLMKKFGKIATKYPVAGTNVVEKADYACSPNAPEQGKVWINKVQHFEGVPPEVWELHVGGYQVCQKWLKDRKGRNLEFHDIQDYQRIIAALAETISLMELVDEVIDEHGGWPFR
jgi:hypothetical protein